jgi:ketosteroid isomerase-like protein
METMRTCSQHAAVFLLLLLLAAGRGSAAAQADSSDAQAIEDLISKYAAVANAEPVDTDLASRVWLNSAEDSLIFPLGEAHGWEEIKRNFYQDILEAYFSDRKLIISDITVHPYGDSAWAEFHWHFTAKSRKGGSAVETTGVETQIYRKIAGEHWALVHVHYSTAPGTRAERPPAAQ